MSSIVSSKRARNSSIELLRIIAMLFIVMSHSSVHGNFPNDDSLVAVNNYFLDWLVLGNLGADIFVMISGYFLCAKGFRTQSVIRLLTQVWFFSYLCLVIYIFAGNIVSLKELISSIFPTIFGQYWFFTAYIALLVFTPYINAFINSVSRKQLLSCLSIMLVLWSILPTFTTKSIYGSELPQFLMLYLIGAYLKKYPDNTLSFSNVRAWLAGCSAILLFSSSVVLRFLNDHIWSFTISETWFYSRASILVIGLASSMVSTAVNHRSWSNKIVNTISSCTFGVYLLHDNSLFRKLLWPVWLNNDAFYDSQALILRILLSVMIVYIGCTLVEVLRQKLLARPMEYLTEKVFGICSLFFERCIIDLQNMHESK